MDESQIIIEFQSGEERAFKYIFNMFNKRMSYFANGLLNYPEEAEDIVQDAFIKLLSSDILDAKFRI